MFFIVTIMLSMSMHALWLLHALSPLTRLDKPLAISLTNPWLAASPGDKVHDPTATPPWELAEYKNPHSAKDLTISEACQRSKSFCLEKTENNTFKLKSRHDYYYQVQCQMYCTIPSGVILLFVRREICT